MRYFFPTIICLTLFFSSCGKMEKPVFNYIDNFKIQKPGVKQSLVTLDMQFFNPNNSKAKLKSADGEAWLDSNYVGHFYVDTTIVIPPKSNFTIPVKLNVEMKNMLIYSLGGFKNEDVLVTVKGKAKVSKGLFSKKVSLDYNGKQNLAGLVK
jgi:LEA14-like dessication related protein